MEAPKFTGQNPETHTRLLHMMMFIFKKSFHEALFWDALYKSFYLVELGYSSSTPFQLCHMESIDIKDEI